MASSLRRRFAATATRAAVTAAIAATLSLSALAQQPTAAPATPGATTAPEAHHMREGHHMRQHGDATQRPTHAHGQRHEKRLENLKGKLQLTATQEPAWSQFTAAMLPGDRPARLDHKDMGALTTPERIDRMRALRAQHAAEADRRGEVTKAFYAVLTPAQQKTFDAQAHRGRGMKGSGQHGHYEGKGNHSGSHGMRASAVPAGSGETTQ